MSRNMGGVAGILALGLLMSGCGSGPKVVDDIARTIGTSSEDVMKPLSKHAEETGSSVEELAGGLQSRADDAAARYRTEPIYTPQLELACDTMVNAIESYEKDGSLGDAGALNALLKAVAARNQQMGIRQSLESIQEAANKAARGEDVDLDMLLFTMTFCPVVTAR